MFGFLLPNYVLIYGFKLFVMDRLFLFIISYSVCVLAFLHPINLVSAQTKNLVSSNKYIDWTNNLNVEGEVKNNSSTTAVLVQVIGTFYDSAGQVVGTEYSFTNPNDILPGAVATFHIILSKASIPIGKISNYTLLVRAPL
jgi:hypothetical protein